MSIRGEKHLLLSSFSFIIQVMKEIYEITWQDAAYTYQKEIPNIVPGIYKTIGYLVEETDQYINLAVSFKSDSNTSTYADGFVIPKGVILNSKKIN